MSYVYGTLRTSITGTPEGLSRVSNILPTCERGEDFKDWFLTDWASAVKAPKQATHGRQTDPNDHIWDDARAAGELLVALVQKMPGLGTNIVWKGTTSLRA